VYGFTAPAAFTLVELLVVIAIIAILASLILPALNRSKIAADSIVCRNNLHQYGVGLQMYVDDFKVYPPGQMSDVQGAVMLYWHQRLQNYTHTKWTDWYLTLDTGRPVGIHVCPAYAKIQGRLTPDIVGSYGYNFSGWSSDAGAELGLGGTSRPSSIIAGYYGPNDLTPVRVAPADMIAIGDARLISLDPNNMVMGSFDLSAPDIAASIALGIGPWLSSARDPQFVNVINLIKKRHTAHWNVTFCDAHVESLTTAQMWDARVDRILQRWNRDHQPHPELLGWFLRP